MPSMDSELSLNRGRADSGLPWDAANNFDRTETDNGSKLTNGYPDAGGNYFSYATAYITIDPQTSAARVLDFDMQGNGSGQCKLISQKNRMTLEDEARQ